VFDTARILAALAGAALFALGSLSSGAALAAERPKVRLVTSMGEIVLELFPEKAPGTVANFLQYVRDGFYQDTVFHRVIPGFMIQGGGLDQDLTPQPTRPPIANEADSGLKNEPYTVAMARTSDPHSATAQFFVNVADNEFLNFAAKTPQGWGYAVFGQVVEGQRVVDRIAGTPTTSVGPHQNVPRTPVVIEKAEVVE
jgi:peptidyl-prolyl cis-trans isomerase B (cyclophilin B)